MNPGPEVQAFTDDEPVLGDAAAATDTSEAGQRSAQDRPDPQDTEDSVALETSPMLDDESDPSPAHGSPVGAQGVDLPQSQDEAGLNTVERDGSEGADEETEPSGGLAAPVNADPASSGTRPVRSTGLREAPGLKTRGVFVIMTAFSAFGCLVGFIASGTAAIPSAAGWGLLIGSIIAAVLSPRRLGWTAMWMPPLAVAAVIAVMGQVTLLGSMPTVARELAMMAAGLTAVAPAQLASVVAAAVILWVKRRAAAAPA
jgi:hypothetical protein